MCWSESKNNITRNINKSQQAYSTSLDSQLKKRLSNKHCVWGATGSTKLSVKKYSIFQLTKPHNRLWYLWYEFLKNAKYSLHVGKKSPPICLCGCFVQLCHRKTSVLSNKKREVRCRSHCPVCMNGDYVMWFLVKNVLLFPRCMVRQSLNHNKI